MHIDIEVTNTMPGSYVFGLVMKAKQRLSLGASLSCSMFAYFILRGLIPLDGTYHYHYTINSVLLFYLLSLFNFFNTTLIKK